MDEQGYNEKDKVINLRKHRMRKKHKRFYAFFSKIHSIFHKDQKHKTDNKDSFKRTVNH